jgi:purine-binding chemotaxis protein CheW
MSRRTATTTTNSATASLQVIEFTLGSETYCVSIDRVAELVHMEELTDIPNSARHVEGVMDLRGETVTIVDPKVVLGIDEDGPRQRVVVFDDGYGDQGEYGWVVDEVDEVLDVTDEMIDDTDDRGESVQGIIKDDDEFKLWLDPDHINDQ